ncbi:MAG TPA: DUF4288 domain-containing protein [Tepidisphaeraceae bacterium]|nr:DUF4288 domain-containing protein [Tepidisphaeraceae bacterium]
MPWYAVRTVYDWNRRKSDGKNIFEERIVAFEAATDDDAFAKAEAERDRYADFHQFTAHDEQAMYLQDGDPLIDGYEVWSRMYESHDDLDAFYAKRYDDYAYHPE